ncbi:MAG: enoyl-CoA hydratase/isomerase family protein [Acidimicrobiia bacterium]
MSDLEEELQHRVEGGVAWITLNRPEAGNSITPAIRNRMTDLLDHAGGSLDVRAVVIGAVGERHFCTGADLRADRPSAERPEGAPERTAGEPARMMRTGMHRLISGILDCEKPVLCALNGTAAGGGAQIALASDLIVAADTARIIQVFVRRGLIPDGGAAYLLPRRVGLQKAKEMIFFGDDLPAEEAARLGLVNKVVPAAELAVTVKEWAERLAGGPTKAIGFAKRLLNRSPDVDRATLLEEEALLVEIITGTHDSGEGVAAFVERRPPEFKGW